MKIAIPVKSNNQIDAHFGNCEFYHVYTVSDDNKIVSKEKLDSPQGCGCKSDIATTFQNMGVKIMLAGGIGNGAINKLEQHNIKVIRNCEGDVDELITSYLAGNVVDGGQNCASHEAHSGTEHVCNH